MSRKIQIIIAAVLLMMLIFACSGIKEDRIDCPCRLSLVLGDNFPKNVEPVHLWIFDANNGINLLRDTLHNIRQILDIDVKRTAKLQICALAGVSNNTILNDNLSLNSNFIIKDKKSADSLYFYSNVISALGEFATDTICLHKDYAKIDLFLSGALPDTPVFVDLYFSTTGRYVDGEYMRGEGCVSCIVTDKNKYGKMHCSCMINRQEDIEDLNLYILTEIFSKTYLISKMPLGNYLLESGYNPEEADMQDVEISLDIALSLITVTIENWQKTVPVEIEL